MTAWNDVTKIATCSWRCGFCAREVSSDRGWDASEWSHTARGEVDRAYVAICPRCDLPSIIGSDRTTSVPHSPFGEPVEHLPEDVSALYEEARRAVEQAPNSAALACRKILMHVGVERGAPPNKKFIEYVDYLADNNYVPPGSRDWIDEIREHGNNANHEIDLISRGDAETVVQFTEMLLRMVYEYPERGKRARADRQAKRP